MISLGIFTWGYHNMVISKKDKERVLEAMMKIKTSLTDVPFAIYLRSYNWIGDNIDVSLNFLG